ncbi:MAG TPA: hypothetical protein VMS56_05695 [Thermoanaerobaculia bacterium]|nr:hypothetical protein [Thermoanaerobaculia bacterium]
MELALMAAAVAVSGLAVVLARALQQNRNVAPAVATRKNRRNRYDR